MEEKLPDTRKAQISCAAAVAALEGRCNIRLPSPIAPNSTLVALSNRVRAIEYDAVRHGHRSPVAMDPTWESLAWRIWTLDARLRSLRIPQLVMIESSSVDKPNRKNSPIAWSMIPDPTAVSTETLRQMCIELVLRFPAPGSSPASPSPPALPLSSNLEESDEKMDDLTKRATDMDSELLDAIRQALFHVAGGNGHHFIQVPLTQTEIFVALVELSVRLETVPSGPLFPPPPRGMPPSAVPAPPWYHRRPGQKFCPINCACSCHSTTMATFNNNNNNDDSDSDDSSESSGSIGRGGRWRRKLVPSFGWLKKLACWRRSSIDDDSSSSSGRTIC